ncbi:MAG: molybdopterin cofactor-binding domain-containing protein [Blastocatellia bacterium]
MKSETKVSRRFFLSAAAAAGGGLLIGYTIDPELIGETLTRAQARDIPLNAWLRVSTDDVVTLISSQSEMGQGVMTTLPAVLAEELGADWSRVRVEFSPVAPAYANPRINWQFTGNSESTTAFFELLRQMGAAAREMLIAAAANRWGVKPEECNTDTGKVVHRLTGRSLKFGDVTEDAAKVTPPTNPKIKPESEWKMLGKPLPRVDLPAKLNGTAVFGMDFSVPGMVHAAVRQSPAHGGTVASFDKSSVMGMPGVLDVVPIPNGVAVVAGQYWQASQALKSLKVTFDAGANAQVSTDSMNAQYRAALDGNSWKAVKTEGKAVSGEAMTGQFADVYSQEYESQFLAHATMEPMNCTAHTTDDGCTVWGPIQGNQLAQIVLASVLKLPPEKVTINRTLLGGGFGRRLVVDFILQAALVSRQVGKPVKAVWSREEDMQHDIYRPATLQRITAGLDKAGKPEAIAHKLVSPSILQYVYAPAVTEDNDPNCLEGLMETHYAIPHQRVDFKLLKVGVPTSVLRTTGYGPNIFAVESFIDELAHRAKRDPYEFRRRLLKDERAIKVLDTVVEKSGWKKRAPKGTGRGLAITEAFRTHIAHVVELSVKNDVVKIHRIVCVIDCGVALDPEICKNSIEGGTVWGLGAAFKSNISFKNGCTVEANFNGFQIAQMDETPPIEVHIVNSSTKGLGGTGEVGPITIIPALTNALFAATGKRYRSLPLSRHGLKLA